MLNKKFRLTKSYEFNKVFKKSKPVFSNNLSLRTTIGKADLPARFAFIVSNKVDKRSTRRNALKRQLRAIVEELLPQVKKGTNTVITVKKDFDFPYNRNEIQKQIIYLLKKSNLI